MRTRSPLRPLFLLFALLTLLGVIYLANWTPTLRSNPLASMNNAPSTPDPPTLSGVSVDLVTPSKRYAMYAYEDATYLTFPSEATNKPPIDLNEVFPTFTGNVVDFIASDSGKAVPYLMVFTNQGMMYSTYPNTPYSQSIWESFIFLPADGLVGVDARKVLSQGKPVTNLGLASSNLLFTFYVGARRDLTETDRNNRPILIAGEIYNELGCSQSVAWTDPQTKQNQMQSSCPVDVKAWNSLAYSRIVGVSSGVVYTSDGGMRSLTNPSQNMGDWRVLLKYEESTRAIPDMYASSRLAPTDMSSFRLMGCDSEDTAPFFATNEGGYSYVVTPQAKKIPMSRIIGAQGQKMIIHDLTKLSFVENDFLIAGVDGYLYNPYFPQRVKLSDLENSYMGRDNQDRMNSTLSGLTHVISYTLGHKVCFFYSNGDWFFIDYDPKQKKMIGLNPEFHYRKRSAKNPPGQMSWLDWAHIKDVVSKNLTRMIGISSNDWAVYMTGTTPVNGKVYSFSQPNPQGDCDAGSATGAGATTPPPGCWRFQVTQQTGLGDWREIDLDKEYGVDKNGERINTGGGITHRTFSGFRTLAGKGLQTGEIIGVRYWVSLDSAVSTLTFYPTANGFVFDRILNKVTYYSNPKSTDANVDLDKNLYIRESYYTTYKNMFTVQHKPSKDFLFYDFIDSDKQKLDVKDGKNWFKGDISESTSDMSTSMKRSLGGMWGMGSDTPGNNCLMNLNPTLANAPYVTGDGKLSKTCDSKWVLTPDGSLMNGTNCLVYRDGKVSSVKVSGVCKGQWASTPVACPNLPVCGGQAQEKCSQQISTGSCNCANVEYEKSDPCYSTCKAYNACTQACVGPLFAQACQD